jgi:hypothetical protein
MSQHGGKKVIEKRKGLETVPVKKPTAEPESVKPPIAEPESIRSRVQPHIPVDADDPADSAVTPVLINSIAPRLPLQDRCHFLASSLTTLGAVPQRLLEL